jgi:vancomycin resistance protein YoaR
MIKHSKLEFFKKKPYFSIGIFVVICIIVVVTTLLWVLEVKYKDRFYPNILIGDVKVGGLTKDEVSKIFSEKMSLLEKTGLELSFDTTKDTHKVTIPIFYTGLTADTSVEYINLADPQITIDEAFDFGRKSSFLKNTTQKSTLLFKKRDFDFSHTIQKDAIHSLIDNEISPYLTASIPARFVFLRDKLSITQEKNGENIKIEEILNELETKISKLDIRPVTFSASVIVPDVTYSDLASFATLAEYIAKNIHVVFQYKGKNWKLTGEEFIRWLTKNDEGLVSIDALILDKYMNTTAARQINNPRKNSRFQIVDGKLVEIAPGKSGTAINTEKILNDTEKMIYEMQISHSINPTSPDTSTYTQNTTATFDSKSGTFYIPIETIETEPRITKKTVEKYYIRDLVGETRTSFKGSSADRAHNIQIGSNAVNGILIPPGGEFSTVKSIGSVTEKEGYVKETVIKENKTAKEYGGGLCQIATTLFRVALDAGLNITERMNHKFVVHYYDPPGLDATIYGPHPDFRFVNDTNGYLLLQSRVEGTDVIMELYGQNDDRKVTISEPKIYNKIPAPLPKYIETEDLYVGQTKCLESPHDGITTDVLYSVLFSDGTLKEKNFHSVYRPWQKVCLVGTKVPSN